MSYSISNFKLKEAQGKTVPLSQVLNHVSNSRSNFNIATHPDRGWIEVDAEEGNIFGELFFEDDEWKWKVTKATLYGTGSAGAWGFFRNECAYFFDYLHAIVVWEGGDSVTSFIVRDGNITEGDIV